MFGLSLRAHYAKARIVAFTSLATFAVFTFVAAGDELGLDRDEFDQEFVISEPFQENPQTPAYLTAQVGQPPVSQTPGARQAPGQRPIQQSQQGRPSPFASVIASPRSRLTRTPDMFGDLNFGRGGTITATDMLATVAPFTITGRADLALAGGSRGLLVGEHNKALPVDRAYVTYNHYHNALRFRATGTNPLPPPGVPFDTAEDVSIDRFTFGLEKTLLSGWASFEVRMPLTGGYDFAFSSGDPNGIVTAEGGHVGDVSLITKLKLYHEGCCAASAGLGLEAPTGSDADARIGAVNYHVENEAVHLHPYFAVLSQSNEDWFVHAFAQLDLALNGNPVEFSTAAGPPAAGTFGAYDEQTLLHLDLSLGHWLFHDPCAPLVTGLAGLVEVHYTTALEDTDVVTGAVPTGFPPGATLDFRNRLNRFDVVNLATGVHVEIASDTTLRIAGVVPLRRGESRFFDAEIAAQLSRRF